MNNFNKEEESLKVNKIWLPALQNLKIQIVGLGAFKILIGKPTGK